MATSPVAERPLITQREPSAHPSYRDSRAGRIPLLALVFTIGLSLFVSVDPPRPWILLALAALVALGTDGILRSHPRGQFRTIADTAPHLFVPVLFTMSAGLFLEDVVLGYWAVPAVIAAGTLMGTAIYAEFVSIEQHHDTFPLARFVLNVVTYLTAFGFFAVVYGFDVELLPAACAVGLVSMLLAIEIFREAEADPVRALVFAAVIGIIAGEARWVLYFIPLDGFLAGVFLLLVFYLATGVISHYLTDHLTHTVLAEFALVTAAGLAIVIGGRVLG
ncbi:MAG TPA: hypothetical protein VNM91_04315 [Dehalococcoidia bacterium]|nr:hypothetical protein [Dehalococcoidia bacterium]